MALVWIETNMFPYKGSLFENLYRVNHYFEYCKVVSFTVYFTTTFHNHLVDSIKKWKLSFSPFNVDCIFVISCYLRNMHVEVDRGDLMSL